VPHLTSSDGSNNAKPSKLVDASNERVATHAPPKTSLFAKSEQPIEKVLV